MPRTREFDPDAALNDAMNVFWTKGYVRTSYDDLVVATGVSRKSLYATFGDKQKLFSVTLENYRKMIVPNMLDQLGGATVTKDTIREVLHNLGRLAQTDAGQRGCLMARTASDETINMPEVKSILDQHWADLLDRWTVALRAAGYPAERVKTAAPYLVGVMQGVFTLARARADASLIDPFIQEVISTLD